jgi:hypothetical protein
MRPLSRVFLALVVGAALLLSLSYLPEVKAVPEAPAASYVGSRTCQVCHGNQHSGWLKTAHAGMIHSTANKKEVQAPSSKAIKKTADEKVRFKFFRKGKNILITLYDLNGNGSATYTVWNIIGGKGHGHGREQYLLREGGTTMIAPILYNYLDDSASGDKKWVSYYPEHWYNNDGTLISSGDSAPAAFAASQYVNAWERRCAGCHTTGTNIEYDDKTGMFADKSTELNVGCESCHGPGGDHAGVGATPTASNIINPSDLPDDKALEVCGQCHSRSTNAGKGKFTVEWPAKVKKTKIATYYTPGATLKKLRKAADVTWDSDNKKWGEYAADVDYSKLSHQQYTDFVQSAHWKNPYSVLKCWDCHEVHDAGVQTPAKKSSGGHLKLSAEDNSLCLSCHASHGFADTAQIQAHTIHSYNPKGTGTSRCVTCHFPATARGGYYYDIHSHTGEAVHPGLTNEMAKDTKGTPESGDAIPNGCITCHGTGTDYGLALYNRWKAAGGGE